MHKSLSNSSEYELFHAYYLGTIRKLRENTEELVLQMFSSNNKLNILINFNTPSVKRKLIMPRYNQSEKNSILYRFLYVKYISLCLL